jgi:hypothetical protein
MGLTVILWVDGGIKREVLIPFHLLFLSILFQLFSELNRLSTQDWGKEHYLTSLNLQTNQLNVRNAYTHIDQVFNPYIYRYKYFLI